jgi:hypothetical protein
MSVAQLTRGQGRRCGRINRRLVLCKSSWYTHYGLRSRLLLTEFAVWNKSPATLAFVTTSFSGGATFCPRPKLIGACGSWMTWSSALHAPASASTSTSHVSFGDCCQQCRAGSTKDCLPSRSQDPQGPRGLELLWANSRLDLRGGSWGLFTRMFEGLAGLNRRVCACVVLLLMLKDQADRGA